MAKPDLPIVSAREGDGLVALEQALDALLAYADDPGPVRGILLTIELDVGGARKLRNALQLARLNGAAVQ
jgi:hypothetical protein